MKVRWKNFRLLKDVVMWVIEYAFPCLWNNWIIKQHIASFNDIWILASASWYSWVCLRSNTNFIMCMAFQFTFCSNFVRLCFIIFCLLEIFPFLAPNCHRQRIWCVDSAFILWKLKYEWAGEGERDWVLCIRYYLYEFQ